ncbi:putative zinc-type alcohol dehydrogenase AdhD [Echinicola pacifica]|uniref:Zinc-type alcohol dehydrogenase AdhD n=1 Tax=Echinicola pacifica TaxID=346377 RepID=A0A918UPH7_9BACT|nr:Zn-dependent alcohol dehydrogenase [Echinicola pacifica]GGZ24823.1 putative zinc-type alcohol dehydrogenase AdhD [Echinicola pacifica]
MNKNFISSRAAIADGKGAFTIEEIAVASPLADEVLVKVKAAGLCHTDHDSLTWGKPIIMGHEGAGLVVEVGENVKHLKAGDAVLLNWATPCMHCFQCQEGNQHICENNSPVTAGGNGYTPGHAHLDGSTWKGEPIERSFNIGTLSEYTLVKASACVKIDIAIPFAAASILSCGVMTGYGSVVNAARLKPGSSAVVLGAGGVGLNVIQACRIAGASRIIAVDINSERLKMARAFGATELILADKEDRGLSGVAEQVKGMTAGRGADYAFECTAIPALGAAPLAMVRNAGVAVQVSGIEEEITVDMRLFEWDKIYINPLYGQCRPEIDFPKLFDLYQKGDLMLEEMVTTTYPLQDLGQAFEDMLAGKNAKGVIVFES